MPSKEIELFKSGDKVWTRFLEEDSEDGLLLSRGLGAGPFWVLEVIEASINMRCSKLHPQLLLLTDEDRHSIDLLGLEASFPGFWFTKESPKVPLPEGLYTQAEQQKITTWLADLEEAIDKAIEESPAVTALIAEMTKAGYGPVTNFDVGIGRLALDEGEKQISLFQPLVKDGQIAAGTFTDDDDKKFREMFHIKI